MAAVNLGGYDPNTGWPPDDSTGVNWDPDTDIPGQFGRGGFRTAPRLTAPASGPPPGISLSGPGGAAAPTGPDVVPPTNSTIPTGKMPVPRTGNPFTDAHINPATGQPEMLTGPGGVVEKTRGALNPFGFLGGSNPYWRGAIAAGGALTPTPTANDAAPTNLWFQRPSGVGGMPGPQVTNPPVGGPGGIGSDANTPVLGAGGFPTTYANPGAQPAAPDGMPAPAGMPWAGNNYGRPAGAPIGSPAPAVPPPRPRVAHAAGPAAQRQQPNLGAYSGPFSPSYRPNADVAGGARGRQSVPQMTTLDLSKLFSRQQ